MKDREQDCDVARGCDVLQFVLSPKLRDLGGGVGIRRCLPNEARQAVGPWLFFDHLAPASFAPDQGIDVRPHPHIGLATVMYLFEGEVLHRDSLGSEQVIRPGDINLMIAGRGITHSERKVPENEGVAHRMHALQLWLALPDEFAEMAPEFHHYPSASIRSIEVNGVPTRIIMGTAFGVTSPVKTLSETLYVEMHLQAGQSFVLPSAPERGVYVVEGKLKALDSTLKAYTMGLFATCDDEIVLEAMEESRIAIIGGASVGERHIDWNFVSATTDRIQTAVEDWKEGRFPVVPGDTEEFIPFPDRSKS